MGVGRPNPAGYHSAIRFTLVVALPSLAAQHGPLVPALHPTPWAHAGFAAEDVQDRHGLRWPVHLPRRYTPVLWPAGPRASEPHRRPGVPH